MEQGALTLPMVGQGLHYAPTGRVEYRNSSPAYSGTIFALLYSVLSRNHIMKVIFQKYFPLILLMFFFLSACEENELSTGLTGIVFRGPINPVAIVGIPNDEPFSAEFYVYDNLDQFIQSFKSDDEGKFSVAIPPGVYMIIPDKTAPIINPEQQIKEVTVNPDSITSLDLYFDTGIR